MEVQKFDSNQRISRVVCSRESIYLSGVVAPPTCQGIVAQTQYVLDHIEQTLNTQEVSKDQILSATIFLKNMNDFDTMNKIWEAWLVDSIPPARTCVGATLASPHALIEITVVATR